MFSTDFLTDLAERALKTFLQAFLAVWVVAPAVDLFEVSTIRAAGAAGVAAAMSVVSSVVSSRVGDRGTAALLPVDPPTG